VKQVLIRQGGIAVEEVPEPLCGPGRVLVRVSHSCVSPGTELASVRNAQTPLWRRALRQKEQVRRVLAMVRGQGLRATLARVRGRLGGGAATGYSAAGVAVAVGEGADFNPGEPVACAGAGLANHAGFVEVPMNLCVRIPPGVDTAQAATVTLGAIALQGVRRARPALGETVLVAGLGALGLLTVQMLAANGCAVFGSDPDPARRELAMALGAAACFDPEAEDVAARLSLRTGGLGADATLITASGRGDGIVAEAFRATRRKGRVVLVGDVGLNLQRSDFYAKELDFLVSCSYGPGRYDPAYEEAGLDYPAPYVRWTENRNMQAYLELVRSGRVRLEPLVGGIFPVEQAARAYRRLQSAGRPALVLLAYAGKEPVRRVETPAARRPGASGHRVALVGSGSFAQGVHLPILQRLGRPWSLHCVMNRSGASARSVAEQYGAAYATTELEQVLADPEVDWLLVCSRHDSHGDFVLRGLQAGKAVFVEKPLCLTAGGLQAIRDFYAGAPGGPQLFTGYNRRFSPAAQALRSALAGRTSPLILDYRMNAGFVPGDSWLHGREGGGRNLGEACHVYDLFLALVGSPVVAVRAQGIGRGRGRYLHNDNFIATLRFQDGSLASLTYTALGSQGWPKEHLEAFWDDTVAVMEDYRSLAFHGVRRRGCASAQPEKGHLQEWQALARAVAEGRWAIPLDQQLASAAIALQVEAELERGE